MPKAARKRWHLGAESLVLLSIFVQRFASFGNARLRNLQQGGHPLDPLGNRRVYLPTLGVYEAESDYPPLFVIK